MTVRDASGELEASTVNGKLLVTGGSFDRAALESVSGGVHFEGDLSSQGDPQRRDGERRGRARPPRRHRRRVHDLDLQRRHRERAGPPAAKKGHFTPQKELSFTAGGGGAQISVETLSGTITIRSGRRRTGKDRRNAMNRTTWSGRHSLAAALALPAAAAQDDFHWQGKVAAGKTVEIKGVNGGITATGSSGGEVEVVAVKKGHKSDPAQVKIDVVEHAGGVTICAVYPTDGAPNQCVPGKGGRMNGEEQRRQRRVPGEGAGRACASSAGPSTAGSRRTGITADAEAETVNGGVELDAAGTARATTVNGGITARLRARRLGRHAQLKTVNGGIESPCPRGLNADVKAATVNGDIETDFPLTVTGKIGRRRIEGTIGSGGRLLELETVNGSIELTKLTATKK